ncbi:uncharacterized protein AB675_8877 [Cyphellophora attinorum]|uniref:Serine aminopeptidase S33 domain-containing protein n=1 Tax=Cyphellophora attinorum TaxID=1664694 RepID=A0A0N1GZ00_9EURO|nr:uncharacterized protein AB675_8877 [Phialophora attinorum]KPI36206.1 hypothetical protein AB675_8877 [Phialophora attinorum]
MASDAEIKAQLKAFVFGGDEWPRAPIWHQPEEVGLKYETIFFPATDGIPIEGWFMPRQDSNQLIVCVTPRWFNRAGFPAHLEPWNTLLPGNDYDVDFVKDYKLLHDAGYNVVCFDNRNFGYSGAANGGITSPELCARDVIGALNYVRLREDTKAMTIGLFSRCNGAAATMYAMQEHPEVFEGIRCMVAPQPFSHNVFFAQTLKRMGLPDKYMEDMRQYFQVKTSIDLDDMGVMPWPKSVRVPTLMYQVWDDPVATNDDAQEIFDAIPIEEKKLHWITGTQVRFEGYTFFQKQPEMVLEWFAKYMA